MRDDEISNPVGADPGVCPDLGIEQAIQRKFPHGGDRGEHIGSPLRDFQNLNCPKMPEPTFRTSNWHIRYLERKHEDHSNFLWPDFY